MLKIHPMVILLLMRTLDKMRCVGFYSLKNSSVIKGGAADIVGF